MVNYALDATIKPPIAFLSRKSRNTISLLCDTRRMKNSARYIAKDHNQKERIFKHLNWKIYKINVYIVYLEQSKRCFVCNRRLNIPLTYVNKIDTTMAYCCNMFLSCSICYDLYDDVITSEFKYMICESNFPFNSTLIKSQCHIQKKNTKRCVERS